MFEYLAAQPRRWWWKERILLGLAATFVAGIATQIFPRALQVGQ